MKYFQHQKCSFKYPVVSMGTFDGVHLGHQKLLAVLRSKAAENGGEAIVITYKHHPLEIIHKKTFPYMLTEPSRKEVLLKQYGVDCVLYLDFDEKMAGLEPIDFLQKIIIGELKAKELVVGYDTHFGKFRQGNYDFLKQNAEHSGYQVDLVEPYKINNRIISSSLIRDFVREGDMIDVTRCLGRNYSVFGSVSTGHRIGREMGFPTINVIPADPNKLLPGIGVYICEIVLHGITYQGVTNIGYSPTLKKTLYKEIETFILDFSQNIYDQEVEIVFHKKIRDEIDFAGIEELIREIQQDVKKTREYFKLKSAK
ncbi:MAG: bifunctional riboflavin kinase/FAD synthetase [Candidatus Cloacimonadales bacterium]|nr:bifunctional riboflavin kinase/FAD synthetase [Candidatus Cloacimonadales bacterium]